MALPLANVACHLGLTHVSLRAHHFALLNAACLLVAAQLPRKAYRLWMIDISWVSPKVDPCVTNYGQELLCLDTVGPGRHARVGRLMELGTEAWVPSPVSLARPMLGRLVPYSFSGMRHLVVHHSLWDCWLGGVVHVSKLVS